MMTLESKHIFIAAVAVVLSTAGLARAQGYLPRKGLVASWTGDGHARDSVGKNHGTMKNGATYAQGKRGKAFKFDGTDDYVYVGNTAAMRITGNQTIAMWIRPDRVAGRRQCPFAKSYGGEGAMVIEPAEHMNYYYGTAGRDAKPYASVGSPVGTIKPGRWTHIAVVRDLKARKLRWYVDGKLVGEAAAPYPAARASSLPVHIGHGYAGHFGGLIDDVGVWNRALDAGEIRGVFNGPDAGLPHITRVASSDRVELIDDNVLLGTVENKSYTIATSLIGKIKIPAARVIGIVAGTKKDPRVRLVLTDGQVVVGRMGQQVIQLTIAAQNGPLKIPIRRIREFGYQVSKEKPAAPVPSGPMVILAGGYRLTWTECKQKLQLRTPSGAVDLPIKGVVNIQAVDPAGSAYKVVFRNGSTLTGALLPRKFTLKLQLGSTLRCPTRNVRGFVMLAKHVKPTGPATVKMRNGDQLFGKIADQMLTIRTEFGDIKSRPANLMSMVFDPKKTGQVKAKTWDGATISGRLVAPTVTVSIGADGPTVTVPAAQIASIINSSAQPPPPAAAEDAGWGSPSTPSSSANK